MHDTLFRTVLTLAAAIWLAGTAHAQDAPYGSVVQPDDADVGSVLYALDYWGSCNEYYGQFEHVTFSWNGTQGGGGLDRWITGAQSGTAVGRLGDVGGPCTYGVFVRYYDVDGDGQRGLDEPVYLDRDDGDAVTGGDVRLAPA